MVALTAVAAPAFLGWTTAALGGVWNVQVAAADAAAACVQRLAAPVWAGAPLPALAARWHKVAQEARYPSVRAAILRLFLAALRRDDARALPAAVLDAAEAVAAEVPSGSVGDVVDLASTVRQAVARARAAATAAAAAAS